MKIYKKDPVVNGTPVFQNAGSYKTPTQQVIDKSIKIGEELDELSKSISSRAPVYKTQQEADAEINATVYNKYTKDRQTYSAPNNLSEIVIKASNSPEGYRSDNKSLREDLLNTSPIIHSKVPRIYDRYKISDRISYEAAAVNPATEGLINTSKRIAEEAPLAVAPIPFIDAAIDGVKQIKKLPIYKKFIDNAKYVDGEVRQIFNEAMGEILYGKENRTAIKEGNEWMQQWINHPATNEKITKLSADRLAIAKEQSVWFDDPQKYIDTEFDQISSAAKGLRSHVPETREYPITNQINDLYNNIFRTPDPVDRVRSIHTGNAGVSYLHYKPYAQRELVRNSAKNDPVKNKLYQRSRYGSFVSRNPSIPKQQRISNTIHEGTHDWANSDALTNLGQKEMAMENMADDVFSLKVKNTMGDNLTPSEQLLSGYYADPTEMHARIMELRYDLGLTPESIITPEYAQKVIHYINSGHSPVDPIFNKVYGSNPQYLANIFNKFLGVAPVAGTGAAVYSRQKQANEN